MADEPSPPKTQSRRAKAFARNGYVIVRKMIDRAAADFGCRYVFMLQKRGEMKAPDGQVPNAPKRYADSYTEALMESLVPKMSHATGLALYPTYSYLRIYGPGDTLAPHQDRESCQISVTLNLGQDADEPWPIFVDNGKKKIGADLGPGDALIYRGCDLVHWRDAFKGRYQVQTFLHYVDANGDFADWKFDKRPALGMA